MTYDEAETVVRIMMTADSGCPSCAGALLDKFVDEWPTFRPIVEREWGETFATEFQPS